MRRLAVGMVLIGAIVLGSRAASGGESGMEALDAAWIKAMKANDADAVAACYASDAVLWLPNAPEARGSKAIHEAYAGLLAEMTVEEVGISRVSYQTSGDLASSWGNFSLTLQPKKGGDRVVMQGRFLDLAKRIGGRWQYVADQTSLEPPPAPPKP